METQRLRAVVFQEQGYWVAQCLERNVAAQAREFKDILYELERVLAGRLMHAEKVGVEAFEGLPKAPRRYWDMFETATADILPRHERFGLKGKWPELELRAA